MGRDINLMGDNNNKKLEEAIKKLDRSKKKYNEVLLIYYQICEDCGVEFDPAEISFEGFDLTKKSQVELLTNIYQAEKTLLEEKMKYLIKAVCLDKWLAVIDEAYDGYNKQAMISMVLKSVEQSPSEIYSSWSETFDLLERICGNKTSKGAGLVTLSLRARYMSIQDIINKLGILKDVNEKYFEEIQYAINEGVKQNNDVRLIDVITALFPGEQNKVKICNLGQITDGELKQIQEGYQRIGYIAEASRDKIGNVTLTVLERVPRKTKQVKSYSTFKPGQPGEE